MLETIHQEVGFKAKPGAIYAALMDSRKHAAFTGGKPAKNWPKGVFSIVTFTLKREGSGTRLTMDHTNIPAGESAHLDQGWHSAYWKPLAEYLAKV